VFLLFIGIISQYVPGYKQRKHIAKALQVRSQAIRTALDRFNASAQALHKETLRWEDVVEYSFLSEFDLLRDARQDIRTRPWATPAGRQAMDTHFKIQGAQYEIERLNVEIRRLITYMRDEEQYLQYHIHRIASTNPLLAHQLKQHYLNHVRFNDLHRQRLLHLSKQPGFTGTIIPGSRLHELPGWTLPVIEPTTARLPEENGDDFNHDRVGDDDEEDDDDLEGGGDQEAENVLRVLGD
jgi:hypothetical protein